MQRDVSHADHARRSRRSRPVARDLRFLLALDHVSYELERMGDHAGIASPSRSASSPRSRR